MSDRMRFLLDETRIPKAWYNINADMPVPPQPVLHPGTLAPVTPDFLSVLFPMSIIMQEVSTERWIEIPKPVRDIYRLWSPTPMPAGAEPLNVVRHGAGYSVFESQSHGLNQDLRLFAAPDAPVKIARLRLQNLWDGIETMAALLTMD